jgi:hypothetical protein
MQVPLDFRKKNSRTLIRRYLRTRDCNIALSLSKFWYPKVVELEYDFSRLNVDDESVKNREAKLDLSDCIETSISKKTREWRKPHCYINEQKDYC